ncbi:MAG: hypothetical protein ACPGFB_13825 [Verrucomicrobiales bacterium]
MARKSSRKLLLIGNCALLLSFGVLCFFFGVACERKRNAIISIVESGLILDFLQERNYEKLEKFQRFELLGAIEWLEANPQVPNIFVRELTKYELRVVREQIETALGSNFSSQNSITREQVIELLNSYAKQ